MHTILIVDDEYLIADILGMALEDEGYNVVKTNSGHKGLDVLDRDRPSLVVTDYMMPGMNGAELAKAIRARPGFIGIPIVLMTGAQGSEGRALPELFTTVFDKPFNILEMVSAIGDLVQHPQ